MRDDAVVTIASSKSNIELTSLRGNNYLPVLEEGHSSTSHFSGSRKSRIPFSILGHDLSYLPDGLKFSICSTGVFLFFLIYGYMQVRFYSFSIVRYTRLQARRRTPHSYPSAIELRR